MVGCRVGSLDPVPVSCGRYVCCSVSVNHHRVWPHLLLHVAYPVSQLQDAMFRVVS